MRLSIKLLVVIVSAAVLTIVIFSGLSQLINIDFPIPTSQDAPTSFNKTRAVALDHGANMVPKIDVKFMKQTMVKPPKPNFGISKNIGKLVITEPGFLGCGGDMPLVKRYAPIMPKYATKSGHCNIEFQLDAKGNYINVKAVSCSEEIFAQPSIKAVQRWQMNICDSGQKFDTKLVHETVVTYRLVDEDGEILPE